MALNDTEQVELLSKVRGIHKTVTSRILDVADDKWLSQREILRRVLVIARRSEERERLLVTTLEALTTNLGETGTAILAKVDEALAAVAELDDDIPEGEEPPVEPTD